GDTVDEEHRVSCERRMVTEADREEISRGIAEGVEGKVIAARIRWLVTAIQQQLTQQLSADGVLRVIGCR
ncbi:MAG: hypothetical protein ACRDRU_13395, partial [Pseudonocardiaceae bacterium]